jgi:hypothetical protein
MSISNGNLVGVQSSYPYAADSGVFTILRPMINLFASHQPVYLSVKGAQIQLKQSTDTNGQFTTFEQNAMTSILNALPLAHLQGLTLIQSVSASQPLSQPWSADANSITFYLWNQTSRLQQPLNMDVELTKAIGYRLYGPLSSEYSGSQSGFAADYSLWVNGSMLDRVYNLAQIGDTSSLSRSLTIASLFMSPPSSSTPYQGALTLFTVHPDQTLSASSVGVSRTGTILTMGSFDFLLQGNRIIGMRKSGGAWVDLSKQPVTIPPSLLAKLPAVLPAASPAVSPAVVSPSSNPQVLRPTRRSRSPFIISPVSPVRYIPLTSREAGARLKRLAGGQDLGDPLNSPHLVTPAGQ